MWSQTCFVESDEALPVAAQIAFDVMGVRKIGAIQEGLLRKSFLRGGKHLDQALLAIVAEEWYRSKAVWGSTIN